MFSERMNIGLSANEVALMLSHHTSGHCVWDMAIFRNRCWSQVSLDQQELELDTYFWNAPRDYITAH